MEELYSLADVALRTSVIYLLMVAGLILSGKKEISQLSVVDLVFILLISNAVQNSMVGNNTSLTGGIYAAGVLFVMNYVLKFFTYRSSLFRKILDGEPLLLVYHGDIIQKNMDKEKITEEELRAAVREHGVENISDVNMAFLEVDGNISVLSYENGKQTQYNRLKKKAPLRAT